MTEESTKLRMNLVAIQNADRFAKEILFSSPHVAYYKFINNEWEKSEIEGSFFVYSRVAEPFNSIFINNRLNTNSLVEPITSSIELQSQPPFLLYRNQKSVISGFWFYCRDDCTIIHALLSELIKKCSTTNNIIKPVNHQQQQQHTVAALQQQQQPMMSQRNGSEENRDVDIFSMLSRAQEEFNNNTSNISSHSGGPPAVANNLSQQFAGIQITQHQPVAKSLSVNAVGDITSPNVVNFFAAAHQQPVSNKQPIIEGPKPFIPKNPIIQPVQTVDEIEKQHRVLSTSPQGNKLEPKLAKTEFNNLLNSASQPVQQTQQPITAASPQPIKLLTQPPKPTLITPTMFQSSGVNIESKIINVAPVKIMRPEPLTQNQLVQALNYLIQNDEDFIRKIHEAYIKSFDNKNIAK